MLTGLEETEGTVRERLERISLAYWLADILDDRRRMESLHEMLEEMLTEQATVAFRERRTWSASLALFADGGSDGQYTAPNNAHFLSQISTENRTPITAALVQRTGTYLSAWPYRSTYVNSKLAQMVLGDARSLAGEVVRIDGQDYRIAADGSIDLPPELLRSGFEMRHGLKRPLYLNAEVPDRPSVPGRPSAVSTTAFASPRPGTIPAANGSTRTLPAGGAATGPRSCRIRCAPCTPATWPSRTATSNLMYQPEVNGRSTIERARIVGE